MRIDISYIRKLLLVFLDSDKAHISVLTFKEHEIILRDENDPDELEQNFLFHFQLLMDNGLISDRDGYCPGLKSMGIHTMLKGYSITEKDIRLTQAGHDFAKALENKAVFEKLKTELKDAPFKTIFDGSQKLLQHYFKKKLDVLVSEEKQ